VTTLDQIVNALRILGKEVEKLAEDEALSMLFIQPSDKENLSKHILEATKIAQAYTAGVNSDR